MKRYTITPIIKKTLFSSGDILADVKTNKKADKSIQAQYMDVSLNYLGIDGQIHGRTLSVYLPEGDPSIKHPVIYGPHYEMDQLSVYNYIKHGWAVVTPNGISVEHLRNINLNALRFSMAGLDFIRQIDLFDNSRIALRGASAAGYHTVSLSSSHLGINCSFDLYGGINFYYEYVYAKYNNRFNDAYELKKEQIAKETGQNSKVVEKKKWNFFPQWADYPIPAIKSLWEGIMASSIKEYGEDVLDLDWWRRYSPITHIDEVSNPVLMFHSTADALVPFNQITEKYPYEDYGKDLPSGFTMKMSELIDDEELQKPMDEVVHEDDMEVYRIEPLCENEDIKNLKYAKGKRFSLNYVDEGVLEAGCDHFKDFTNHFSVTEMDFFDYYLNETCGMTNRLTFTKMKVIAKRYLGRMELLKEENAYKFTCGANVFGSIDSDRLDVLLGIKAYLGLECLEVERESLLKDKVNSVKFILENLQQFMDLYNKLEEDLKFFNNSKELVGVSFCQYPITCLIKLIYYYDLKFCDSFDDNQVTPTK